MKKDVHQGNFKTWDWSNVTIPALPLVHTETGMTLGSECDCIESLFLLLDIKIDANCPGPRSRDSLFAVPPSDGTYIK